LLRLFAGRAFARARRHWTCHHRLWWYSQPAGRADDQSNFSIKGIIVMSETIVLQSDHREVVRGIVKDSSVLCSTTSAPDVYIHVITDSTVELFQGDGTVVPKMTSTRFHLFRKDPGDDPFSATVVVTDLPPNAADKSNTLMAAFSMVKHKPDGMKIPKAKKPAKKKAAKKAVAKKAVVKKAKKNKKKKKAR
jgi:hypothetical protein